MTSHKGSCVCGQLTYTITGDPVALAVCHCLPCRKTASASASNNFIVPKDKFDLQGDFKQYTRKGDSGKDVTYSFCSICPTIVRVEAQAMPDICIIKAGTCDDEELLNKTAPAQEIYCKNRYSWVNPIESAAQKEVA